MSKRFILIGVLVLVLGGIGSWYLQKTLLHQAQYGAELDKTNGFGDTALMTASRMPGTASVKLLIERKANVNALTPQGHSALLYAAYNGHVEIVKLLLAAGADPEAAATENGSSFDPMSVARQQRHPEVVSVLAEAQARRNPVAEKP